MRPSINMLVAVLIGVATLFSSSIVVAQSDDTTAVVRDSTLAALKGRQVVVSTADGLSATGELAAFDEHTITIIRTDNKLIELARSDVSEIEVAAAPEPPPAPAPQAQPPAVAAPPAVPQPGPTPPKPTKVQIPLPWKKGVRSANPTLSPYEQELHMMSGAAMDYCAGDRDEPLCIEALRLGAERKRDKGKKRGIMGLVFLGAGVVAFPFGAWQLDVGVAESEAVDACESVAGFGTSVCDELDPAPHFAVGAALTLVGTTFLILGSVFTGVGFSGLNEADSFLDRHQIQVTPTASSEMGGLTVSGAF